MTPQDKAKEGVRLLSEAVMDLVARKPEIGGGEAIVFLGLVGTGVSINVAQIIHAQTHGLAKNSPDWDCCGGQK